MEILPIILFGNYFMFFILSISSFILIIFRYDQVNSYIYLISTRYIALNNFLSTLKLIESLEVTKQTIHLRLNKNLQIILIKQKMIKAFEARQRLFNLNKMHFKLFQWSMAFILANEFFRIVVLSYYGALSVILGIIIWARFIPGIFTLFISIVNVAIISNAHHQIDTEVNDA